MATFTPAGGAPVARSVPSHGLKGTEKLLSGTVAVTTALALNDTIDFFWLPAGATVRSAELAVSTKLDSNVSPTLTLDVGDTGGAARIFSQSLAGSSASGQDFDAVFAALDYQYTADTLIFATVHAAGATKVAGSIRLRITYTQDGLAS